MTISRKRLAVRSALALALVAVAAVPLLGDLGVTGNPKDASAAHIADRGKVITAVSRATNYVDAFWIDADRRIMTAGFVPGSGGGWGAPAQISNGVGHRYTTVWSVARNQNQIDTFAVTPNNRVVSSFWNGSTWSEWFQLGSLVVKEGTSVHAIGGANNIDLFAIGEDDEFYTNRWTSATGWTNWTLLPGLEGLGGVAAAGTELYGVYTHSAVGIIHVYGVITLPTNTIVLMPNDGPGHDPNYWITSGTVNITIRNIFKPNDGGWQGWHYAMTTNKPRTSVYPVSPRPGWTTRFSTDESGQIIYDDYSNSAGWGNPPAPLEGRPLDTSTTFAAVRKRSNVGAEVAVAVPGTDADIWTRHIGATEVGWDEIPGTPKTGESFIMSAGEDRYNVFAWRTPSGSTGEVVTAGWTATGGWTGWTRIDD